MRDRAGQLADSFKLLCLEQLLAEDVALRHVFGRHHRPTQLAVWLDQRERAHAHPGHRAVRGGHAQLHAPDLAPLAEGRRHRQRVVRHHAPVLVGQPSGQIGDELSDDVLWFQTGERGRRGVRVLNAAFGVDEDDAGGHRPEDLVHLLDASPLNGAPRS